MDEAKLENELKELAKEFGGLAKFQHKKLEMLAKDMHNNQERLQKTVDSLRESLDYLRVCIKYQNFDLEATRRENDYLRKLIEERDG